MTVDFMVGKIIDGRYTVHKSLGGGLSGEVYEVDADGQRQALKLLKTIQFNVSREEALKNFKDEFSILKELNHPGVARIYDFGFDTTVNRYYFTTELITGQNFFDATEGKSIEVIEDLAIQVLRALHYVHSRGIYHLDIKPQNILVAETPNGLVAKVIDFGLAALGETKKKVGTPAYMSPEIILEQSPDGRSDLYSFGVLLYKVFTRQNPFTGKSIHEVLDKQKNLVPPLVSSINSQITPYWDHIVKRLLEKKPADRYAQASFAIRDINFLGNKNYEIETNDTKLSYLLEKGNIIGRKRELGVFQELFSSIFENDDAHAPHLIIVSGKLGSGKTRFLEECKYYSQLHQVPAIPFNALNEKNEPPLLILAEEDVSSDDINIITKKYSRKKFLILWVQEKAPLGWQDAIRLELTDFTNEELKNYLTLVTGLPDPPQKLVEEIAKRTNGNPLFVTELLKHLISSNLLLDSMGQWASSTFEDIGINFAKINVPNTLSDLFKEEFLKRTEDEKVFLKWLAIANSPLSLDEVVKIIPIKRPQTVILSLINENLIEKDDNRYFFKNILLGESILDILDDAEERKICDLLSAHYNDQIEQKLWYLGHGSDDAAAVNALKELGQLYIKQDRLSDALDLFQIAFERSSNLGLETRLEIELELAKSYVKTRQFNPAQVHYKNLKLIYETDPSLLKEDEKRLEIIQRLGDTYNRGEQLDEGLELFRQVMKKLEKSSNNYVQKLIIENDYANMLRLKNNVDEALEIFSKNRRIWQKELTETDRKRITNNRIADIHIFKKEYDKAIHYLQEDIDFFESIESHYYACRAYYLMGDAYLQKFRNAVGDERLSFRQKTIDLFEKSIAIAKKIDAYDYLLRLYNVMGGLYFYEEDLPKAIDNYERGLVIAQKTKDFQMASGLAINLSNIYKKQKKYSDALSHATYAINILENLEVKTSYNLMALWHGQVELSEIYRYIKEYNKAEESLNQAGALIRNQSLLSVYEFWFCLEKAKVYQETGKDKLFEEYIGKARKLADEPMEKEALADFEKMIAQSIAENNQKGGSMENHANQSTQLSQSMTSKADVTGFENLLKIAGYINAEHDETALLKMVLKYALELTGAEAGLILLVDEEGEFTIKSHLNMEADEELKSISTRVARNALESGEAVYVGDAMSDGRYSESESVVLNQLRSIICMPIRSQNKVVGVFYLDNRFQTNAFLNVNTALLKAYCDQVGIALKNARLIANYESVKNQLEHKLEKTSEELQTLKTEQSVYLTKYSYNNIISRSQPMRDIFKLLDKITETNLAVYLHGASGTGKELVAKAIHHNNPQRSTHRFVAINCGAIPANLMESELFGHKAGSFTGAQKDKKGLVEEAHQGTLFLDEIGDLDLNLQVKLLRVLQEGEVQRVGDVKPIKVDVRVVCASHKPLDELVKKSTFREDLYFRLCQIKIDLPPLSSRKEDIPPLVEHFVEKFRKENGIKSKIIVSANFLKSLLQYSWPGNIRELENLILVACALREGDTLTIASLPPNYQFIKDGKNPGSTLVGSTESPVSNQKPVSDIDIDVKNKFDPNKTWADYEALIIAKCFEANGFKKTDAANMLGISPSTLYKKINELNLEDRTNIIYSDSFVYEMGRDLKSYIPLVFKAALTHAEDHPYAAIKQLGVSQGYFYKIIKSSKEV